MTFKFSLRKVLRIKLKKKKKAATLSHYLPKYPEWSLAYLLIVYLKSLALDLYFPIAQSPILTVLYTNMVH